MSTNAAIEVTQDALFLSFVGNTVTFYATAYKDIMKLYVVGDLGNVYLGDE